MFELDGLSDLRIIGDDAANDDLPKRELMTEADLLGKDEGR